MILTSEDRCGKSASWSARGITLAPKKLIRTRRASEGSASEPSLARRVSMCNDAKLSCRGNSLGLRLPRQPDNPMLELPADAVFQICAREPIDERGCHDRK